MKLLFEMYRYKNPTTGIAQPDGLTNERCTSISLYSIHTQDDWNDIACAYDKIDSFICEKQLFKELISMAILKLEVYRVVCT